MSATLHDGTRMGIEPGTTPERSHVNPALRGPVLLATDGTSQRGATVVAARLIAERLGVAMEVVSVLEPQMIYGVALGGTPVYVPEVEDARRANRTAAVLDFVARFSGAEPAPAVHLRFGGIADEIARVARDRSATLIVIGAAPHQRLTRVVAGDRAVHVLRSSQVPVLSVQPGFAALVRNAVVGIDFSPASIRAAQNALLLLGDGGTLTLVHVLSPLFGDAPIHDVAGRDPADAIQTLFGRLRDELRPYVPNDVTIETRIKIDYGADGLVATASGTGADLVAIGTHGPTLLERMFVGSVASSVLHAAPQTVLAVPPPPSPEAMELWLRITGTATSTRPCDWGTALDEFTARNIGRSAAIEVDDPEIGAQMLGRGSLAGVTYDPQDRRVEIMMGRADPARYHLMHSIPNVESIAISADARRASEVLGIRHGGGHTLVLVTTAVRALGPTSR
jgi:nucleotide-binding universal stress UspA family protein